MRYAVFANSLITPSPDFEYATTAELCVWGVCMALAAVFAGWFVISVQRPRGRSRPGWLVVLALVFLTGGCVAATKGHVRHANERRARWEEERRKASEDSPEQKAPEPGPASDERGPAPREVVTPP